MAFREEADVLEGYRLLCFIGQGSFSHVRLALHLRTGSEVAVKVIPRDPEDSASLQKLLGEVDLMKGLHHPHIIELLEVRHTADRTYLVMEYASRGELRCYVAERGHLWEEEARFLFGQILSAVHYCHGRCVVHRDLKLGNLLLDAGLNIKLVDFGLSCRVTEGQRLDTFCGTPEYCAPEVFLHQEHDGFKADVWSLGVVLCAMLTGALPFYGRNLRELEACVLGGHYLLPAHTSTALRELLSRLLSVDARERPTVEEIMGHGWLGRGPEKPQITYVEPLGSSQDSETQEYLAGLAFEPGSGEQSLSNSQCDGAMSVTLVSHEGHTRVEPASQGRLSPPSLGVLQSHPVPRNLRKITSQPAPPSSQLPLPRDHQEAELQAYSGTPMPNCPQAGQLQMWSPGPRPSPHTGPGASSSPLSPSSSEGPLEEGTHPWGVAEHEAVPRGQPGQAAGTSATASDKSRGRRNMGRRMVRFLLRVCCILPASEEDPGVRGTDGTPP